jgi:hypothetical protein
MSQIKEYLEQGRAGKVYDPNAGLYVDPNTGQAFVPTFTNVQNSNIQGEVQKSMAGAPGVQSVQSEPYLVGGQNYMRGGGGQMTPVQAGGAMPGRNEQATKQAPDPQDPWAMAQEHMKSPAYKEEIYRQMFGRDPQSGFRNTKERDMFFKGLQSNRNVLVDRFKWQIESRRKSDELALKNARKGMSQKEALEIQREILNEVKQRQQADPEGFDAQHGGKTAQEIARQEYLDLIKFDQETHAEGPGMPGREKGPDKDGDVNYAEGFEGEGGTGDIWQPWEHDQASRDRFLPSQYKPIPGDNEGTIPFRKIGEEGSGTSAGDSGQIVLYLRALAKEHIGMQTEDEIKKFVKGTIQGGVTKALIADAKKYNYKEMLKDQDFYKSFSKEVESGPRQTPYSDEELKQLELQENIQ